MKRIVEFPFIQLWKLLQRNEIRWENELWQIATAVGKSEETIKKYFYKTAYKNPDIEFVKYINERYWERVFGDNKIEEGKLQKLKIQIDVSNKLLHDFRFFPRYAYQELSEIHNSNNTENSYKKYSYSKKVFVQDYVNEFVKLCQMVEFLETKTISFPHEIVLRHFKINLKNFYENNNAGN